MKKTNLIKTVFKKEKIFWRRNQKMRKELSWVGFIIALIFIVLGRIAIVSMSFLFECTMWIFNRNQFKMNLQKLNTI